MNEFNNEQMHEREATPEQVAKFFERAREFIEREGQLDSFKSGRLPSFNLKVSPEVMMQLGMNPEEQSTSFMSQDAQPEDGENASNMLGFSTKYTQDGIASEVVDVFIEAPERVHGFAYRQLNDFENVDDEELQVDEPDESDLINEAKSVLKQADIDERTITKWPTESRLKLMDDILRAEAKARHAEYSHPPIDL